jgi:hypothetical protein
VSHATFSKIYSEKVELGIKKAGLNLKSPVKRAIFVIR